MKINHGLIAIRCYGDNMEVMHFCGYEVEPTQKEFDHLREELSQDMSFGLTEIIDQLLIITAPEAIVKHYRDCYENGECKIQEGEEKI